MANWWPCEDYIYDNRSLITIPAGFVHQEKIMANSQFLVTNDRLNVNMLQNHALHVVFSHSISQFGLCIISAS